MDWDNLRYFLELARTGRLSTAARRLGVDQATVSRRVQTLEKQLSRRLFNRTANGMGLSEAGQALVAQVEAMEAAASGIEGAAETHDGMLAGAVRVGSTEGFGSTVLAPKLGLFAAAHPYLSIELVAVSAIVSMSRREADIVVSLDRPARGPFVVAKLCDYALRLYGSVDYLGSHPVPGTTDDLKYHAFIGYVDDLLFSKELRYLQDTRNPQRFTLRSTSVVAQLEAAKAGAGLAVLPAFLAIHHPVLVPVLAQEIRLTRTFWMSMPTEMKNLARMRATWDVLRTIGRDLASIEAADCLLAARGV